MHKLILIDGDILVYNIAFSVEIPIYVVGSRSYVTRGKADAHGKLIGQEVRKRLNVGSFDLAKDKLIQKMEKIFSDLGTRKYKMFITHSKVKQNFRNEIATLMKYKGNRTQERPFWYGKMRTHLVEDWGAILVDGQEADDAIGIEQYKIAAEKGNFDQTYIASIDKDLMILEGEHYHLDKHIITYISHEDGLKRFYGQLLTGDATDNIPGLVRCLKLQGREEEAKKLVYSRPGYIKKYNEYCLDHPASQCYNYVVGMYLHYEIQQKIIEEIGQLLWIRRKEGEMWQLH